MSRCPYTLPLAISILLTAQASVLFAQTQTFPSPAVTGIIGNLDPGAVAEVTAYVQAVSASGWQDLEGTGTLTYPAGDSHSTSLYLAGSDYTRMDITMDGGVRSLRIRPSSGSFEGEKGSQSALLFATSRVGIFAFSRIWAVAAQSNPLISLFDHGLDTSSGQSLHRITIEYPLYPGLYNPGDPTIATDLYFDPNTHLLVSSVDIVTFQISSGPPFQRVMTYSSYQRFNGVLVASTIQQFLDGQPQWTFQINQAIINGNPPLSTFSF